MDYCLDIILSPKLDRKNFHEFFGIYGSLPLSYTDRFLQISKEIRYIFAIILQNIPVVTHRFDLSILVTEEQYKPNNSIVLYDIHPDYNRLSTSSLGSFVLGSKIPVYSHVSRDSYGSLGNFML